MMDKQIALLVLYAAIYWSGSVYAVPQFGPMPSYIQVPEDHGNDSELFDFTLTDSTSVSATPSGLIEVRLKQGSAPPTYAVYLKSRLDRESIDSHTLSFRASDSVNNEVSTSLKLYVTDVNDNVPVFENTPYFWNIPELPHNLTLSYTNIKAYDPDRGNNGTVMYMFVGDPILKAAADDKVDVTKVPLEVNSDKARNIFHEHKANTQSAAATDDYMSTFEINNVTGAVSLKNYLDYTSNSFYQFTVIAYDLGTPKSQQSNVSLVIRVEDVQNQPPFFTGVPYRANVDEETATNTSVITVTARDGDTGISNQVNYTLLQGSCTDFFTIDLVTGEIATNGRLDRDNGSIHNVDGVCVLTVLATEIDKQPDDQYGNTTTTTDVTITVKDINDNIPTFNNGTYTARIQENSQRNVPLQLDQEIMVSDLDQGNYATIEISLQWTNGTICSTFKVSPSVVQQSASLILQVENSALLDYEKRQNLTFKIVATEKADPSHTGTSTVNLHIEDVNDNSPQFGNRSYIFNIDEGPTKGSTVGVIQATDPDSGSFGNISYFLLGSEDKHFLTSATTTSDLSHGMLILYPLSGEITTICEPDDLDRETISVYYLTVTATDEWGQGRSNSTSVRINLLDVNDNPPIFLRDKYQVFVKENEEFSDTPVLTVSAQDRDKENTNNSHVQYSLQGDPWIRSNITVNQTTGVINFIHPIDYEKLPNVTTGVFDFLVIAKDMGNPQLSGNATVEITVEKKLPVVDTGVFDILVIAQDMGNPQQSGNSTVEITVEDLNDNAPIFIKTSYTVKVQENATSTVSSLFIVETVHAHDSDGSSRNNRLQYIILDGAQNDFSINPENGSVYVQRNVKLDRETTPTYNITILAIDLASNPKNGSTIVLIEITDINDEAPKFDENFCNTLAVKEDEVVGKTVATCGATDADLNHELQYHIIDVKATDENGIAVNVSLVKDYFEINSTSGAVYVSSELDRETAESIQLTLLVEDIKAELNVPQNDTKLFTIRLLDVNDNDPVFVQPNYTMSVSENARDGANLDSVSATDRDKNRTIRYSIEAGQPPTGSFVINAMSGMISKNGTIDRETNATVLLHITATDNGVPSRNSTVDVLINVIDFNDNAPIFYPNSTGLKIDVYENATLGDEIVTLMAYDLDEGQNAEVTFEIESGGNEYFQIDRENGTLTTSKELDRETTDQYIIRVIAMDNPDDKSQQKTNLTTVTINILDVNDNAPEFSETLYHISISEIADVGTVIQTITATDRDAGNNSVLSYSFGNDTTPPGLFRVEENTGTIRVNSSLRKAVGSYLLVLVVEDGGFPGLRNSTVVNITITDYNINAPVIGNLPENNTIRVYECYKAGTVVYIFNYTDEDQGNNAKAYFNITAIEQDNVLDKFEITADGQLKLKATLDVNVADSYRFQIEATDRGSPTPLSSEKHTVSIVVLDVNNYLPGFDKDKEEFSVQENQPSGTYVGTVSAIDEDKDSVTCYNISERLNAEFFEIGQRSGMITTKKLIDRELVGNKLQIIIWSWDCTVATNDACGNNSIPPKPNPRPNITVVINILDVDDNPPEFVSSEMSVGMRRNEEVGYQLDLDLKNGPYVVDNDTDQYGRQSWVFQNNGTAIVSTELQGKVQPGTGVDTCSPGGEKNLFCITGNGSVINNKFFNEDMSGYFLLPVTVRDAAGSDQSVLKIYLISDSQVLIMTIFDVKQNVAVYRKELLQLYSDITGHTFVYDGLQDHKTPSGGIDTTKADLYFHIVDPKTEQILPSNEAQRLIDGYYDKLRHVTTNYKVLQVLASTGTQATEESDPMRTVYILAAVVVLLALTVAVIVYVSFSLRRRYKRKIKALSVDKTVIAKEESNNFIPGSNQYSKTSNPLLNAKIDMESNYDRISLSSNDSIDKNEVDTPRDDASYDKMETKEKTMDMYIEEPDDNNVESPLDAAIRMHEINRASMESDRQTDTQTGELDDNRLVSPEKVTIQGYVNEVFDMETSDI